MRGAVGVLLRMMIAIPLIMMMAMLVAAGFQVVEPVHQHLTTDSITGAEDGFGQQQTTDARDTNMQMTVVGLVLLVLVPGFWLIYGSLRDDTRQRRTAFRRGPPPR